MVSARSPVYAAMNLVAAFFFMAGIYVLLAAHLIAFMQILVYAGAVMVLFLFVIMLLSLGRRAPARRRRSRCSTSASSARSRSPRCSPPPSPASPRAAMRTVDASFGTVKAVGNVLYTQYLLPFEATSLLLLVAIVGAVVVAKERI